MVTRFFVVLEKKKYGKRAVRHTATAGGVTPTEALAERRGLWESNQPTLKTRE
jgi:hypothetical protein